MNELRRHQLFYNCLLPFIQVFNKWKFNYEFDSLKNIEGPYLILPNHNLELDPLLIGVATGRHTYFVASEHVYRAGFASKVLRYAFEPIAKRKGTADTVTVMKTIRALREGKNVCLFPEGQKSFDGRTGQINIATGKLVKASKASLITYKLEGGYFTTPRWGYGIRKGKMYGSIVNIYTKEDLDKYAIKFLICSYIIFFPSK